MYHSICHMPLRWHYPSFLTKVLWWQYLQQHFRTHHQWITLNRLVILADKPISSSNCLINIICNNELSWLYLSLTSCSSENSSISHPEYRDFSLTTALLCKVRVRVCSYSSIFIYYLAVHIQIELIRICYMQSLRQTSDNYGSCHWRICWATAYDSSGCNICNVWHTMLFTLCSAYR
jgi:hypothetical protein